MNFSVKNLTTSRKWRAATGLTAERFAQLLAHFKQAYFRLNGTDMIERGAFAPYEVGATQIVALPALRVALNGPPLVPGPITT
ncbi:hypothetical protein [Hymenobacter siberiensis]|uniref:hypothetical protein n=1 Tax=Hymenobacter siberiensis TaxID=2848396 RepID=UPI001C1E4048|nr:hypothetical protein [Hymenobacter siberiensis]